MKIAIIGAGISGMVTAYLLSRDHDVAVFEANDYMGGHTHTVDIDLNGRTYPVDTGFIVFNEKTYPHFVTLMGRLGVASKPSKMSFSVRCERTALEYSPTSFHSLFAQRRNLFRPTFLRMLMESFRFRRQSQELIRQGDEETTLGHYLASRGYSDAFIAHFIIPMGAAIWSADPVQFHQFPAGFFVRFFNNHGFLNVRNQPQWLVIEGGSRTYVPRLTEPYRDKIRLNTPVASITRRDRFVEVRPLDGEPERFDHCVVATHSDQALDLLADPTEREREVLGSIPYQENLTLLHTDTALLPRHRSCWASWNYRIPREKRGRVTLTYDMNILQGLRAPVEFCVTLNEKHAIAPARILREFTYHHPVYTPAALVSQKRFKEISGRRRTHYCGAYWGYGFHEDGVRSALAVCEYFGKGF